MSRAYAEQAESTLRLANEAHRERAPGALGGRIRRHLNSPSLLAAARRVRPIAAGNCVVRESS